MNELVAFLKRKKVLYTFARAYYKAYKRSGEPTLKEYIDGFSDNVDAIICAFIWDKTEQNINWASLDHEWRKICINKRKDVTY